MYLPTMGTRESPNRSKIVELHVNGTNSIITATREIEAEDWGIRFEAADR